MSNGRTFEAVPIVEPAPEDDIEYAFNEWVEGLKATETPGLVRAFRVPMDEQGKPSYSATGQVRLGSWPIDQYDFDTLCSKILKEYMLPTETLMAVRLLGTIKGKGGASFNKLVILQRPNPTNALTAPNTGGVQGFGDVLRQMQESNERMIKLVHEMAGNKGTSGQDGQTEMMRTIAMMRVLMEPMQAMMGPILEAVAGRPPVPAPQTTSLKETLEQLVLLDRFVGRRGGGSRSDFAEIATAVSGVAKPVLEMAAASWQENMRNRHRAQSGGSAQQALPNPQAKPPQQQAQPQPAQTQPRNDPTQTPTPPPTASPVAAAQNGVDLSKPSSVQASPFVPGADMTAPSTTLVGDTNMFAEIKKQVDTLVAVAQEGADPIAVANQFFETVLMQLDDKSYGLLCHALEAENYLETLAAYNVQVRSHADWFTRLRARLIEHIVAADQPEKSA